LGQAEKTLVDLAAQAPPASVRKAGYRLLSYWDVEGKEPKDRERELAGPYREFTYHFTSDGQMHFSGQVDSETAASAVGMFATLAKPEPADEHGRPDPRTATERQGDALAEIIALASRVPDLPAVGGENMVVTVTVSLARSSTVPVTPASVICAAAVATPRSSRWYWVARARSSMSVAPTGLPPPPNVAPWPCATSAVPDPDVPAHRSTALHTMSSTGQTADPPT
jgi:hypothetical protein